MSARRRSFSKLLLAATGMAGLLAPTAAGQVKTDGTVGPARSLAGPSYSVGPELGTRRGGNLFHSFQTLNVNRGESLTFSGPADVTSILARVTGGRGTTIDGTLASTIDGADLFLINPNGIIFGENARLDVRGNFIATTADVVKLQDGGSFHARRPSQTVLTSAPATAFGFLGPNSNASLRVRGSRESRARLALAQDQGIALVGQSVDLQRANVSSFGGPVGIAALTSGEVSVDAAQPARLLAVSDDATRGPAVVRNRSVVQSIGFVGGAMNFFAEDFTVRQSTITTISAASGPEQPGGDLAIDVSGTLAIEESRMVTSVVTFDPNFQSQGRAGNVTVRARHMKGSRGGVIGSIAGDNMQFVIGGSGNIWIEAETISMDGRTSAGEVGGIAAGSIFGGDAGDITLRTQSLSLTGGSEVEATTFGTGAGGNIDIEAAQVLVSAPRPPPPPPGQEPEPFHGIRTNAATFGEDAKSGGDIRIAVGEMTLTDAAVVSASALLQGDAGNVDITADNLFITGDGGTSFVGIFAGTSFSGLEQGNVVRAGDAGDITINADTVRLARNGAIVAASIPDTPDGFGPAGGNAGNVLINARRLIVNAEDSGGFAPASIFAGAAATEAPSGAAGSVTINAGVLRVFNSGIISSETNGVGPAGEVNIVARDVLVDGETEVGSTKISSSSNGGFADGGNLSVAARRVAVTNGGVIAANSEGDGNGGNLAISADTFILSGQAAVEDGGAVVGAVSAGGNGDGGTITLNAGSVAIQNGGLLAAVASGGTGDGGRLIVRAGNMKIDGGPSELETGIGVGILAGGAGAGGQADIQVTGELVVRRNGFIIAGTEGSGPGGDLAVSAGRALRVNAGTISVASGDIDEDDDFIGTGPAGSAVLTAPYLRIEGRSDISAFSELSSGGSITLIGENIDLLRSNIRVNAATTGGSVVMRFTDRILAFQSQINAVGTDAIGTIDIDPQFTILNQSALLTDTRPGGGGNINIVTDQLLQSQSTITAAGIISIDVLRADTDVTAGLLQLRGDLFDASKQLKEACGMMLEGDVSSFIVEGRGGMPVEPGGLLTGAAPATQPGGRR